MRRHVALQRVGAVRVGDAGRPGEGRQPPGERFDPFDLDQIIVVRDAIDLVTIGRVQDLLAFIAFDETAPRVRLVTWLAASAGERLLLASIGTFAGGPRRAAAVFLSAHALLWRPTHRGAFKC